MKVKKRVVVLGGGGFIGGHLSKRLKEEGSYVRIADIKNHEYWSHDEICDDFIKCDLTNPVSVSEVIFKDADEVYQLAADMGGAGYIFTGNNDANVMHNSALINLNVAKECVVKNVKKVLSKTDAVLVPGGFGDRGIEGMILACKYARANQIPYLGICLGMQVALIEFARNVLKLKDANSTEFDQKTNHPVIALITEWSDISGKKEQRNKNSDMGGTMRLGAYKCKLEKGSRSFTAYGKQVISERHRHRYEFNNEYLHDFETNGLMATGINPDNNLVEVVEIPNHPWFVGVQYHPELKSTVDEPHPLFVRFVKAAIENSVKK